MATLGMMLGERPDDRRAPIVPDPNRLFGADRVDELDHVGDDEFERVILVSLRDVRAAIAAHVRRDRAEAESAEDRKLTAPGNRQLRPAVQENDRRGVLLAAREIKRAVTPASGEVLRDGEAAAHSGRRSFMRGRAHRAAARKRPARNAAQGGLTDRSRVSRDSRPARDRKRCVRSASRRRSTQSSRTPKLA